MIRIEGIPVVAARLAATLTSPPSIEPPAQIVMRNWIPEDATFASQLLKSSPDLTAPPPEDFVRPTTWGVDTRA